MKSARHYLIPLLIACATATVVSVHPAAARQADSPYLLRNPEFIRAAQTAIDSVYNFNYAASVDVLRPWMEQHPDHPAWTMLEALPVWWNILSDLENESHDDAFIALMKEADRKADQVLRRDRRHLDALVIKAMANGFLGRMYSNRSKWYSSISHARISMNLMFNIEQIYPDIADLQFGLGLYYYYAAYLTEEYRLVRAISWMIPGGDKEEGLRRLTDASQNSAFVVPEAFYFLGHINLNYERDFNTAERYFLKLVERYPNNPFFKRLMMRTWYRNRNYQRALTMAVSLIDEFEAQNDAVILEEAYTVAGMVHFRRGEGIQAEGYFSKALGLADRFDNPGKREMQVSSRYHLARLYQRSGRTELAKEEYRNIIRHRPDSPYLSASREHLRELESNR